MTRDEFRQHRQATLKAVIEIVEMRERPWHTPTYVTVLKHMHSRGLRTAWGNEWTMPRLCMFLNRMGYVGLHGVARRNYEL
ncbi:hypothetical protein [Aliiglaciecola sp. M165]|uniref:hypothetical protein n=1 Tax=Aliiglaciecola sp. M165 TaxID=2593649 RepID=UPI00117D33AC|nr:hypothetical protein [Aliiglaciecola sp. M165]TRY30725.1 hypothetical protein FM019_12605 [Aliiglaciecola sp. M165]